MKQVLALALFVIAVFCGFIGCGKSEPEGIAKSEYNSYRDYWYDKTVQDVGTTIASPVETTFDFGILPPYVEQSYRFKIKNNGDKQLHLLVGPKTCKCTEIKILDRIIEPQETGEVELNWTTVEFAKQFRHSGSVFTNDPDQKRIQFFIQGKVAREFGFAPNNVDFQRTKPDTELVEAKMFLFSGEWDDFRVTNIISTFGEDLQTELLPPDESQIKKHDSKNGFNLYVKLRPPKSAGWFNGNMKLTIEGGGKSFEHEIDVLGKVIRRISLNGVSNVTLDENGVAGLGRVEKQSGHKAEFFLTVNDPQKQIAIKEVKASPTFVKLDLKPLNNKVDKHGVYRLSLTIPPGQKPDLFNRYESLGLVEVTFDHPRV